MRIHIAIGACRFILYRIPMATLPFYGEVVLEIYNNYSGPFTWLASRLNLDFSPTTTP